MSLRIVPAAAHPNKTALAPSAPSAPGVHDTLRSNLSLSSTTSNGPASSTQPASLQSSHPLESRLRNWRATQDQLKMSLLRREYGIAEPVKRSMEASIVGAGEWRPLELGGSAGVHSDVLAGRDADVEWEDVFKAGDVGAERVAGFHAEMEARVGMHKW